MDFEFSCWNILQASAAGPIRSPKHQEYTEVPPAYSMLLAWGRGFVAKLPLVPMDTLPHTAWNDILWSINP